MIERRAAIRGLPALGLWAQVPHYVAAMPYPAASLALLEGANRIAGLDLPDRRPARAGRRQPGAHRRAHRPEPRAHRDARAARVAGRPATPPARQLSATSGDELAAELERFLREQ